MALHKIRENGDVTIMDDEEYKRHKRRQRRNGCLAFVGFLLCLFPPFWHFLGMLCGFIVKCFQTLF